VAELSLANSRVGQSCGTSDGHAVSPRPAQAKQAVEAVLGTKDQRIGRKILWWVEEITWWAVIASVVAGTVIYGAPGLPWWATIIARLVVACWALSTLWRFPVGRKIITAVCYFVARVSLRALGFGLFFAGRGCRESPKLHWQALPWEI
jgi:hypothetical protein